MNYKCLIVDDEITIAENTAEYFNMFDIPTAYVTSYEEAEAFFNENCVSLVLLDVNLGDKSGFTLCKKIRESYDIPILFISARNSDDDVLTALSIGGDDYICKPFSLNVLFAKAKAVLARYEKAAEAVMAASAVLVSGQAEIKDEIINISEELTLDTKTRKLLKNGKDVPLKAMEYKMLLFLLQNRGRVVTKDELLKYVWEDEYIGEGTLAVHARHLREKTERDPKNPEIIKTIWGVGYMIE